MPPERVSVLGRLAQYQTVTGFAVTPVVGWIEPPFPIATDPVEVADVFEVPLAFLLDRGNQQRHFRMLGEVRRDYFAIPYAERYIWGATAAMLVMLDRTLRGDRRTECTRSAVSSLTRRCPKADRLRGRLSQDLTTARRSRLATRCVPIAPVPRLYSEGRAP